MVTAEPAPPKIVLKTRPRQVAVKQDPDELGWQKVESRRTRRARLKELRAPRRPVPLDLRGRCFNCFSPAHRAAACRKGPRCFKCHELGHRFYFCPSRSCSLGQERPKRLLVWRPKASVDDKAPPMEPENGGGSTGAPTAGAARPRRPRRRTKKRRRATGASQGDGGPPSPSDSDGGNRDPPQRVPAGDGSLPPPDAVPIKYRRIIDGSPAMVRAEDELRKALSVFVVGDVAAPSVEVLTFELA